LLVPGLVVVSVLGISAGRASTLRLRLAAVRYSATTPPENQPSIPTLTVSVGGNRYSVSLPVGRRTEVRETKGTIDVYDGPRLVARHERVLESLGKRVRDPQHFPARPRRRPDVYPEEQTLLSLAPELAPFVAGLKARNRSTTAKALRRLLGMLRDYPKAPLLAAVSHAAQYGLFDLERLEAMVLKRIARDYFLLEGPSEPGEPCGTK
jgi:hypothetical protein